MNLTHFTSGNYLTIRSESGQYSVRFDSDPVETVSASIIDIDAQIERLKRRRSIYSQFIDGNSVQCPSALRL